MHKIAFAAALLIAAPAAAQTTAGATAPAAVPVDPARLALARTAIDSVWPLGTYARLMKGTMDQMMDTMMESMFDMRASDFVPANLPGAKADPEVSKLTMRQIMEKQDPHFQERLRITNRVMMEEMIPLMSRFEPDIREGLAVAYARKFTSEQLADLNRFFATPTGRVYAAESMVTMMDPEVMERMTQFAPQLIQAMPAIMEKVKAATASLPPPTPPAKASH